MLHPMASTALCEARGDSVGVFRRQPARIGQALVFGPYLFEVSDVFRSADDGRDRAVSFGRRSDVDDLHAIGACGDELEVLFNLFGRREAPVVAHAKAEVRFGRRNLCGGLCQANRKREQGGAKNADAPASGGQS
jgi:hypothetical protein